MMRLRAEGGDEERIGLGGEAAQGGFVALAGVIVAEQHAVDGRERSEGESGGMHAARARPLQRTGAVGEHRVGETIAAGGLEEKRGMADPGGDDFAGARSRRRRRPEERNLGGPAAGARGERPAEQLEAAPAAAQVGSGIGFPVELGGERRCHRGVALMTTNSGAEQPGRVEGGSCA